MTINGVKVKAVFQQYMNGRTAIELIEIESGEPYAMASVNLDDEELKEDEICIKDYSENEGVLDLLVDAGYVSQPVRFADSGFVVIPICKLLKRA